MGVAVAVEAERIYSREEFRQWCERQVSGRYERIDGRIVAMAPERGAHLRELRRQLTFVPNRGLITAPSRVERSGGPIMR
jgi:Uma2 family endonuclease